MILVLVGTPPPVGRIMNVTTLDNDLPIRNNKVIAVVETTSFDKLPYVHKLILIGYHSKLRAGIERAHPGTQGMLRSNHNQKKISHGEKSTYPDGFRRV
jgi:hypothetical protein